MFLVFDNETSQHVFINSDPRDDGFTGDVITDVTLDVPDDLTEWPDGARCPEPALAVSPTDPTDYRLFKYDTEAKSAGFRVIGSRPVTASSYAVHVRSIHHTVPVGSLRLALHNAWDRVGPLILRNSGSTDSSPIRKRQIIRTYLDGESRTNQIAARFWHPLKDYEKIIHLLDAFPDKLEFAE
jgi:hypothetical protein